MNVPATAPFTKYHGLGNDFLLFDASAFPVPPAPERVRLLCDRHTGIGADGILLIDLPPAQPARMIIYNADGSRAETCGNALRCVALHLATLFPPAHLPAPLFIQTDATLNPCTLEALPTPDSAQVTVEIGLIQPPTSHDLPLDNQSLLLSLVSVGNPHAVLFTPDAADMVHRLGLRIATHPSFPGGINASFATVRPPNALTLHVWERGAGPTLACGTGACATVAAAVHQRLLPPSTPIAVHLPGGTLWVTFDLPTGRTTLTGPAVRVFRGFASPTAYSDLLGP